MPSSVFARSTSTSPRSVVRSPSFAELRREVAELRRDTETHFVRVDLRLGQLQTDMKSVKDDVAAQGREPSAATASARLPI